MTRLDYVDVGGGRVNVFQHTRWYENEKRVFAKDEVSLIRERAELMRDWISEKQTVLYDAEHITIDEERGFAYLHGYLPFVGQDKKEPVGIHGTSLMWAVKLEEDYGDVKEREQDMAEKIKKSKLNILMHGHSSGPTALLKQMTEGDESDDVVRLALGLMGAEGTVKSEKVVPGEGPREQFLQVMEELRKWSENDKIIDKGVDERVELIYGHSMQGQTVLELAADREMRARWKNALFMADRPVIRGSRYDKLFDKHVYLHAGGVGMLVKSLGVLSELPEILKEGVVKIGNEGLGLGVFGQVLGPLIRERAIAATHFVQVSDHPKYLRRANYILEEMTNLLTDQAVIEGCRQAVLEKRLVMMIGESDIVLNPKQMHEFARQIGMGRGQSGNGLLLSIEKVGHYMRDAKKEMADTMRNWHERRAKRAGLGVY